MKRTVRRRTHFWRRWHLGRAAAIIGTFIILSGGAAFAVLQSQQIKLTSNTVQTATAGLQLSTDGTNYSDAHVGFDFMNLIPGGPAVPEAGHNFYLKNTGGTPLNLKFAVSSTPSNPSNVNLSKVKVNLIPIGSGTNQTFSLQALIAASINGGIDINYPSPLTPGAAAKYGVQVSMDSDAITGNSAAIGNLDFAFTGVTPAN